MDRIALITGAAQGIGAGIARRLAADGFLVAVLDRQKEACASTVRAVEAAGGRAVAVEADVASEQAVAEAVAQVCTELGPPTVLVNNAGFARDGNLAGMTAADWDDVIGVHLRGSFLMTRAVLPSMTEAGWGRVVSVSSTSSQGHASRANYCAAKAGLHGFIKSLAVELGPLGITANVVAPGLIVTAMTEATAQRRGVSLETHLEASAPKIPVRRVGHPDDIAHAVSFFVSEGAGFVTGQVLYVAGGPHD